ncbi:MAG: substrate-binding domain-containing protein [Bryobacteraceae bacterium]
MLNSAKGAARSSGSDTKWIAPHSVLRVPLRRSVAVGLLLLLAALAGCQRSQQKVIAVVPKGTAHIFWISVEAGAMAAGQEFGVKILWNGPPAETDYSRQIEIVDSMVARRVDGLVVAPTERNALVRPIDRAMAQGIPVTVFDSGLDSTNYVSFVATNNFEGGQMAARKLAELIGGKGNVAMVMNAPGSASTMERERGFTGVIGKDFPNIKIVATQYGQSDRALALQAAENILSAHPDLNGFFASAEPSSIGTAIALKSRGLAGKVKFVAFDSSDGMVEDLKTGVISAMVVQDPFKIGYTAVKTIVDKLHGITPPKRIDLSATVVTKDDLGKPAIEQLLKPDIKKYVH